MLQNPQLHYLDNAATTIVAPEVADVINKAMREHWANPSSLYGPGARSEEALNAARAAVARTLGCKSRELYFTSCGSESNNLALLGAVLVQVCTGLFSNDADSFTYDGYLSGLVGDAAETFHNIHVNFFNLLLALACVHVATVLVYKFLKKKDLIHPMVTGYKELEGRLPELKFAGAGKLAAALAVAVAAAGGVLAFALLHAG